MTYSLLCKTAITLTSILVLSGCFSPDYNCPLHDKPRACLSQLQAYKLSQTLAHQPQAQPSLYHIKPIKPYDLHDTARVPINHTHNSFTWHGYME